MQHILISMDQINSSEDILSFVEAHATFKQQLLIPPFERHPLSVDRSGKVKSCDCHSHLILIIDYLMSHVHMHKALVKPWVFMQISSWLHS